MFPFQMAEVTEVLIIRLMSEEFCSFANLKNYILFHNVIHKVIFLNFVSVMFILLVKTSSVASMNVVFQIQYSTNFSENQLCSDKHSF